MKLREIKVGLMLLLPWQEAWAAEAFSFNRAHLHGAAQVDLQKYQYGNPLHAGQYRSTLSVNGRDLGEEMLSRNTMASLSPASHPRCSTLCS